MSKYDNCLVHLARFILDNQNRPFEWGKFDCCLFVADAVKVMTGEDYAAEFRGRYRTEIGAYRALKRYGQGTLTDTLTAKLGEPVTGYLKDGDICLIDLPNGPTSGVYYSRKIWVPGEHGLQPHSVAPKQSWRL